MNKNLRKIELKDGVMAFFFAVIIPYIVSFFLYLIYNLVARTKNITIDAVTSNTIVKIMNVLISQIIFIVIYLLIVKLNKIDTKKYIYRSYKLSIVEIILLIVLGAVTLFGFNELVNLFVYLMEKIGYSANSDFPFQLSNIWNFFLSVITLCIVPAICEELLFRGLILNAFRNKGNVFAVLLSALCFCLIHGSPSQTILQFVMGVILGYMYIKTNSMLAPMIMHFLNNFLVILINYILTNKGIITTQLSYNFIEGLLAVVYAIVACLVIIGLVILLNYFYKKKKHKDYVFKFEKKYFASEKQVLEADMITTDNKEDNIVIDIENDDIQSNKKMSAFEFRIFIISIFVCIVIWIIQLL